MLIKKVFVSVRIQEKIFKAHGVAMEEMEGVLLGGAPRFFRAKGKRHIAVGFSQRFITIVFEYRNGYAAIVTAYPSAKWQIRRYKRK